MKSEFKKLGIHYYDKIKNCSKNVVAYVPESRINDKIIFLLP